MQSKRSCGALVGLSLLAAGPAMACSVADIEIKSWSWQRDAGWVFVAGELVNHCTDPTGVQIRLTFRDETGAVVDVDESWVTGTRDVAAGEVYAFTRKVRAYATTKSTALQVVGVRRWGRPK